MDLQLTLALRYLSGRKLRTTLTTLAIMFGVMIIFGMNSMLPTFINSFTANAKAASGETDATITSQTGEAFPEAVAAQVAAVEGVTAVSASLERGVGLPADYFDRDPSMLDRVSAVTVVGAVPHDIRSMEAFMIQEGRFLEAGDSRAAVVSQSLAEAAGVGVGERLSLPATTGLVDLTVVGILPQRLLPGNEEVIVTLAQAQAMFEMPGKINVIDANFAASDDAGRLATEQALRSALGPSYTIGVLQPGAELLSTIYVAEMVFNLLGFMGLLMGGFIIFNTFRTIVVERRRDIGMLRAVGASRGTIMGLIFIEGLVQGVIGTAAGLVLGYGLASLVMGLIAPMAKQFINLPAMEVPVLPGLVAVSVAAGLGITLLAGFLPARSASRITPLEALRPDVGAVSLKRMTGKAFWAGVVLVALAGAALLTGNFILIGLGSLLFMAGLLLASPALVYPIARLFGRLLALVFVRDGATGLAEGNLARQPSRAALTASTTMLALALVLMAAAIITSASLSFKDMLRRSLGSDYLLVPPSVATWGLNVGASPDLADTLRAVDGVEVVSTIRFAGAQINGTNISLLGIDPQAYQQTSGLTFQDGDPQAAFQALESGRGLIVNGVLSFQGGLQLGDTVSLLTPTGQTAYTVVGIGSDYLNAKIATGYISLANIASDFERREDVFYQMNLAPGADPDAAEAAFKNAIRPYPQFKLVAGEAFYEQNATLFDTMFVGMYAMVLFLAIPSLIAMVNTLAIGVIERRREIGMLRAVGATRRQVRRVIVAEALILAAIGTAFGLLSGLYLGYMTILAMDASGFPIQYIFPASGVVVVVAAGLIFGALAALIPASQAAGLQIVNALRYE